MKKILLGSLFFILLVFCQVLYIDHSLNKKLNAIKDDQYSNSNRIKGLFIKTSKINVKVKNVLVKSRNRSTNYQPILVYNLNNDMPGIVKTNIQYEY